MTNEKTEVEIKIVFSKVQMKFWFLKGIGALALLLFVVVSVYFKFELIIYYNSCLFWLSFIY